MFYWVYSISHKYPGLILLEFYSDYFPMNDARGFEFQTVVFSIPIFRPNGYGSQLYPIVVNKKKNKIKKTLLLVIYKNIFRVHVFEYIESKKTNRRTKKKNLLPSYFSGEHHFLSRV